MLFKEPDNLQMLLYYTGIVLTAIFGGVSGYFRKIQRGLTKKFSFFELIIEAFISVFVGMAAFYICEMNHLDSNTTRVTVLITSHFSTKAIYILEFLMDRQAERIGIKHPKEKKMTKLLEQLKRHEGYREHIYRDTMDLETIGYGYCLSRNPLKLTESEINIYRREGIKEAVAAYILQRCIDEFRKTLLVKVEGFNDLDEVRQDVLINMAFNIGVGGLLKFKNTLAHIRSGQYKLAASEMLDSNWARQVHGRANELALQMETGKYA